MLFGKRARRYTSVGSGRGLLSSERATPRPLSAHRIKIMRGIWAVVQIEAYEAGKRVYQSEKDLLFVDLVYQVCGQTVPCKYKNNANSSGHLQNIIRRLLSFLKPLRICDTQLLLLCFLAFPALPPRFGFPFTPLIPHTPLTPHFDLFTEYVTTVSSPHLFSNILIARGVEFVSGERR